MKNTIHLALSAALLAASISCAKAAPKVNPFTELLASVPAAEMPAKAAEAVRHAKSRERTTTTADVVKAALGINPAAAPATVGAIAGAVPVMASLAAGVAAAEQPKQAAVIAKAAAAAAPGQARMIVLAVCRAVPGAYREVALAVSQVVPSAAKDILSAVSAAFPGLKPYIEQALVSYGGSVPSVPDVLDQATKLAQAASGAGAFATSVRASASAPSMTLGQAATPAGAATPATLAARPLFQGPVIGPPYIPLTITPTNVSPGSSGPVPSGGRNYAAP